MPQVWNVRAASLDDARLIAAHRYPGPDEDVADLDAYAAWLAPTIERGDYLGFIAEADDHPIAGAGGVILDWGPSRGDRCGQRARVVNVFTDPAWRRQGIAKRLVDAVVATCVERGVRTFSLSATPASSRIYEALGFRGYSSEMILRRGPDGTAG